MAKYTPPADATVIDDSGLVSVYRMANGHILFVDETVAKPFSQSENLGRHLVILFLFFFVFGLPLAVMKEIPLYISLIIVGSFIFGGINMVVSHYKESACLGAG